MKNGCFGTLFAVIYWYLDVESSRYPYVKADTKE